MMQVPGLGRMRHVARVEQETEDTWLVKTDTIVAG